MCHIRLSPLLLQCRAFWFIDNIVLNIINNKLNKWGEGEEREGKVKKRRTKTFTLDLWEARTIFKVLFKVRDVYDIWNFPTGFIPTSIRTTTMMTMIQRISFSDGFSGTTSLYFPGVLSINRKYVYVSGIQLTITRLITQTDLVWHPIDYYYSIVEINIWHPAFIPRHFIGSVAIKLNRDQ